MAAQQGRKPASGGARVGGVADPAVTPLGGQSHADVDESRKPSTRSPTADPASAAPLVDTIHGSSMANLKELRPGTVRILFAFDPWRSSILLVAGDKAGKWNTWYLKAIPLAEQRYERYLKERTQEEEQR